MTSIRAASTPLLVLAGLLLVALPAWARGGRYGAPQGARPPMQSEEPTPAPEADPEPAASTATRALPPTVAPPASAATQSLAPSARSRRVGAPDLGVTDWLHWYEARRDRFENMRALLLTDANPVFAVGGAHGLAVGHPAVRVGDRIRDEIRRAVARAMQPESGNWLHTEGAAYVALGKVAATNLDLKPLFAAIERPDAAARYVQESAVLGLGHLGRHEDARRLPSRLLDEARRRLLAVLLNDGYGSRTRAFAGVALGLLGDQPTLFEEGEARWTADHLFRTWITRDLPDEVQVGILLGLAELDPEATPAVIGLVLEGCALRGRAWPKPVSTVVRAHTLIALGHLGRAKHAAAITSLLTGPEAETPLLRQAAAIAAAVLGERHADVRSQLGEALLRTLEEKGEPGGRHLAWIALGRILAKEVEREDTVLLDTLGAGERLLARAKRGASPDRSFAALALALAVKPVKPAVGSAAWQMLRFDALEALRAGIGDRRTDAHTRAAFCVALGLTGDRQSGERLVDLLSDEDQDPELRAFAALALGLTRDARPGVIPALTRALATPRSEALRMRAATALGLLGAGSFEEREKALRVLLLALRTTRSQVCKGQIAVTLGRIGDASVVAPLVEILEGESHSHLNRAIACAALGLVGAETLTPALASLRERCHYMSGSDVVFELLDLL